MPGSGEVSLPNAGWVTRQSKHGAVDMPPEVGECDGMAGSPPIARYRTQPAFRDTCSSIRRTVLAAVRRHVQER